MGVARSRFEKASGGEQRMSSVHCAGEYGARVFGAACAALLALALSAMPAGATSRIKDLANIEGVRQNQLIGYGLVVRDARRCHAPHHEGLRPHPEEAPLRRLEG